MQKYDLCSGQSFRGGRGNFWLKCPSSAGTRCDRSLEVAIIEIGAHGGELLLAEWYSGVVRTLLTSLFFSNKNHLEDE